MGYEEDDDLDYGYVSYEYDVRKERPNNVDSILKMVQWKDECCKNKNQDNIDMAAEVANNNCTHYMCEHGEHGFDSYQDCFRSAMDISEIKDKCFNNAINEMIAVLASTPLAGKPSIDLAKRMYEIYLNSEVKI